MPRSPDVNALLTALRARGDASARELAAALGKSQPTVSRLLKAAGASVARWGSARHTRYGAARDVHGLGSHWPVYRIDTQGNAGLFGDLTALHGDACLFRADTKPDWLRGEFADGHFPGIPWFLGDMRPQGFLGRQFAHRMAADLGLPEDLHLWGADAILTALLLRGADVPGNLVLGDRALRQAQQPETSVATPAGRAAAYAKLADAAMAGEIFGSSAAGEQPKFTTCIEDGDGRLRHVLIKFTERTPGNPVAQRWADLLVAEHAAAQVLIAHGHASVETKLIPADGRLCLETTRFDRVGRTGRVGTVTLAAWSDAHDGRRDNWAAAAQRMQDRHWISAETARQVQLRWWFGQLIGNTDMHFGNLTFYLGDALPLRLAPSYDMLPMRYAPGVAGGFATPVLQPQRPLPGAQATWLSAAAAATTFWRRVADTSALSADFRRVAAENAAALIDVAADVRASH